MAVRGATPEIRAEKRRKNQLERRNKFFTDRIVEAPTARQKLSIACDYAKAVGDDLDETGRLNLAKAIAGLADERSKP